MVNAGKADKFKKRGQIRKVWKGAVTRKENILATMCSFSASNLTSVKTKTKEMVQTMKQFRQQHVDDYSRITDISEKTKSEE